MMEIRRLQRHHRGHEIRVPKNVSRALKVKPGDYLSFEYEQGNGYVILSKVKAGGTIKVEDYGASKVDPETGAYYKGGGYGCGHIRPVRSKRPSEGIVGAPKK